MSEIRIKLLSAIHWFWKVWPSDRQALLRMALWVACLAGVEDSGVAHFQVNTAHDILTQHQGGHLDLAHAEMHMRTILGRSGDGEDIPPGEEPTGGSW